MFPIFRTRRPFLALGAECVEAIVTGLFWCGASAAGPAAELPDAVIGQWEMSIDGTNDRCRLALRGEQTRSGALILALPYGCRKAFPILADVRGWVVGSDGQVELVDASGAALLRFTMATTERLSASGPGSETYRLTAVRAITERETAAPAPGATPQSEARAKEPAVSQRPADIPGRYAILRDGDKDTGCMLTLDDKAPGQGGNKVFLAPACRDQGVVIFDPVGWRIAKGRLVLTARKGHTTTLDFQPDGTWQKVQNEAGKKLGLKKL